MSTIALDPAAAIAAAGEQLLDELRQLVDRGADDVGGLLDELTALLRRARGRVNRATRKAQPVLPLTPERQHPEGSAAASPSEPRPARVPDTQLPGTQVQGSRTTPEPAKQPANGSTSGSTIPNAGRFPSGVAPNAGQIRPALRVPRGRHRRTGQRSRWLLLTAAAVPLVALPAATGWVGVLVDGLALAGGAIAALIHRKGNLVNKIAALVLIALVVLAGPALTPLPATQATPLGAAGSAATDGDRIYRLPDDIVAARDACYRTEREARGIPGDLTAYTQWWHAHAGTPERADWDAAWHRCQDQHQLPGGKWAWDQMIYVGEG